ncbi:MAG TPA: hypothetical protein VFG52_05015, partial [Xanthomonadales bacterium]|nr:hypothetical protein [Xanthomonadales bacterium]
MIKKLPLVSTTLTAALASLLMMGNVWAQDNGGGAEPPAGTSTTALVLDGGWQSFSWGAGEPVDASPEFTLSGAACISVVDAFLPGDQFSVFDGATNIGSTFAPVLTTDDYPGSTGDPAVAFTDDNYSRGSFEVGAGDHQFRVSVINNPFNNGSAFIRADSDTANCDVATSPSSSRATFSVTKIFADGNDEAEITVSIDCNTGLILDQDKLLSNGESVEFVVTS